VKEVLGQLQKFQELFGRGLEARRPAIDEKVAVMEAAERAKVTDLERKARTHSTC
jgi:hypothetical protein